jgi:hypothetical protein
MMMRELPKLDIRVIVTSIRSLGSQSKNRLYEWRFTALPQRFGLSAAGEPVNFIVLDWESEKRDYIVKYIKMVITREKGEEKNHILAVLLEIFLPFHIYHFQ